MKTKLQPIATSTRLRAGREADRHAPPSCRMQIKPYLLTSAHSNVQSAPHCGSSPVCLTEAGISGGCCEGFLLIRM